MYQWLIGSYWRPGIPHSPIAKYDPILYMYYLWQHSTKSTTHSLSLLLMQCLLTPLSSFKATYSSDQHMYAFHSAHYTIPSWNTTKVIANHVIHNNQITSAMPNGIHQHRLLNHVHAVVSGRKVSPCQAHT